jgi:hypothetical protein
MPEGKSGSDERAPIMPDHYLPENKMTLNAGQIRRTALVILRRSKSAVKSAQSFLVEYSAAFLGFEVPP